MTNKVQIGIIAPSAKVPQIELGLGVEKIKSLGFQVKAHSQCRKSYLFFAGKDEDRANALYEYAKDPKISVLWCARGGYGSVRLLPLLETLTRKFGTPEKKLLVGYSDSTALMEFVRTRWGWSILHGPMPSMRQFSLLPEKDLETLSNWLGAHSSESRAMTKKLEFWGSRPTTPIEGKLIGGNLTVWNTLTGTRFAPQSKNSILFFEDIDESLYRIDRMLQQLWLAGQFEGVKAILLGNFLNCNDGAPRVLRHKPTEKNKKKLLKAPRETDLKPLRSIWKSGPGLKRIFSDLSDQTGIPIGYGIPSGHGPDLSPLPLGAQYLLMPNGRLELKHWDWLKNS